MTCLLARKYKNQLMPPICVLLRCGVFKCMLCVAKTTCESESLERKKREENDYLKWYEIYLAPCYTQNGNVSSLSLFPFLAGSIQFVNPMSYGGEAQYHLNMHWCQINFTLALHSSPSSDYMEVVAAVQGTRCIVILARLHTPCHE